MGRDDILGIPDAGPGLQQLGDQLDAARVNAVLRLLEPDQGRRLPGAGQGQHSQDP